MFDFWPDFIGTIKSSNVAPLIAAGGLMLLVIGGLAMLSHHYTLSGIKARTVGDGQHGTARWATKKEIQQIYSHVPFNVKAWRKGDNRPEAQGLVLGCTGKKNEVTAIVDSDDIHSPVFRSELKPAHTGGIVSASIASSAHTTATTTNAFNTQLQGFLDKFNAARAADASTLNLTDPNSVARNRGVYRAWEYEKADVMMGGRGSANWNDQECQDIIDNVSFDSQSSSRSGVRGAEGHHQKNVADHPGEQANPDNIKFYKTREEHLEKGHGGDFHNESDAPMIDKNKMLEKTNSKRVYKNELRGLGVAVAIGLGVGFTIGVVTTLAQSGITPDSLKHAAAEGVKGGLESGVMSAVGYGIGRTIGQVG